MYERSCIDLQATETSRERERDLAEGISEKDENVDERNRETKFLGESREKKMEIQINLWEFSTVTEKSTVRHF